MKPKSLPLLAALAIGSLAPASEHVSTDPVGYISHTAYGKGAGSQALSLLGPTLVQPTEYVATTSINPSGLTTLTFPSGVPTSFGTAYVLEITSGAEAGWWSTVVSSTATTITINDAVPTVGGNVNVAVRKHNTLLSFLGKNSPGLTPLTNPALVASADQVQFLLPSGALQSYVYLPESIGNSIDSNGEGWFAAVGFTRADSKVILPGEAIILKIQSSTTNLTFTSTGTVKLTPTDVDVYRGKLTLVTQTDAAGATLADTGFADDFQQASAPSDPFDRLQFLSAPNGSGIQSLTSYGAAAPGVLAPSATPFVLPSFANASTAIWPEGVGAIVLRNGSIADGTINLNAATVAP